jgi:Rrf2 family iron-sulfur cluster assembly transcriptional regulator
MKISALEEYGLRCLLRLGRCPEGNSLTINEIADQEGMSIPNARKLLMLLREAGFVDSVRGRTGGYVLKEDPATITVGHVLEALGGRMFDEAFCGRFTGDLSLCMNSSTCTVRSLWGVLDGLISGVLHRIRLSDLIGTEGSTPVNLRRHLEATIDELLGRNGQGGARATPPVSGS